MDEWDDDAYIVIYDEQDRERTTKPSNNTKNNYCCGIPFIFLIIGLFLVILMWFNQVIEKFENGFAS